MNLPADKQLKKVRFIETEPKKILLYYHYL